jgi:hypothetical protein
VKKSCIDFIPLLVLPAQADIQGCSAPCFPWAPAFAGEEIFSRENQLKRQQPHILRYFPARKFLFRLRKFSGNFTRQARFGWRDQGVARKSRQFRRKILNHDVQPYARS